MEDIQRLCTGKQIKKRGFLRKIGLHVATPIFCSPCIVWSTVWRILACPFQCLGNGPGFCCSNNGCTTGTDLCLEQTYAFMHQKYPWLRSAYDSSPSLMSSIHVTLVNAYSHVKECENSDFQRSAIQYINQMLVLLSKPKVYIVHNDLTVHKFQTLLEN